MTEVSRPIRRGHSHTHTETERDSMKIRKMTTAFAIGALTVVGGVAADGPPEGSEAQNGCQGTNEAQGEEGGNGNSDADALEMVEELITDDDEDCDDEGSASGDNGRNSTEES